MRSTRASGRFEPPHFHARYADSSAVFEIASLALVKGDLPGRAHGLVVEWACVHQGELAEDWERARRGEALVPIDPLR
ncbi:MAG: DUF4160 domain-containing protein [Chloroflexota bacterium]